MEGYLLTALLVLLTAEEAEALREPQLCYVLDGILFVYGIILTFLYCRLKIHYRRKSKFPPTSDYEKVEGIYTAWEKTRKEQEDLHTYTHENHGYRALVLMRPKRIRHLSSPKSTQRSSPLLKQRPWWDRKPQ